MSKFSYEENELNIISCQCELCVYYNGGTYSKICPLEIIEKITDNNIICPKLNIEEDDFIIRNRHKSD